MVGWETALRDDRIGSVILALPPSMHRIVSEAAIRAGKHVLVEKPIAETIADADAMIKLAATSGLVLAVGENIPFRPDIRAALGMAPAIGEPRMLVATAMTAGTVSRSGARAGILLDFAVHYVRAVRLLAGEPDSVFSILTGTTAKENCTIVLSSRRGWQAAIILSWQNSTGRNPEIILSGTSGALKIWPLSNALDFYPSKPTFYTRLVSRVRPWRLREMLQSFESQRTRIRFNTTDRMGTKAQLQAFITAFHKNVSDVSSAVEARRDLQIVAAARHSLSTGTACNLSAHETGTRLSRAAR
jgi:predicted dehydrogenase